MRIKIALLGLCLGYSINSIATTIGENAWYKHPAVSIAVGPNWLSTNNTTATISSYETDSVRVNSMTNNAAWKVGVGYDVFEDVLSPRAYLNRLLVELNLYHVSGSIKGDVWQYQLSQFNNYSYRAPFKSTRLMLDFKPYLRTYKNISPYFIAGIGVARNTLSYAESSTSADVSSNSALNLGNSNTTALAADLGVGVSIHATHYMDITGEYIYGFLGHASPSNTSSNNVLLQKSPCFLLRTQSVLLGLRFNL